MRRGVGRGLGRAFLLALAAAAIATGAVAAPVPGTVSFTARLVDEESGDLLEGLHRVEFELYDAASGGALVWKEQRDLVVEDGLVFAALGEVAPFDAMVFTGRRLYLQVTLDGTAMEPRVSLESVPYAIRANGAENADAVGGIPAQDLQRRITGTCDVGYFVTAVNPDGTVTCAIDASGSGDITSVSTGSGLEGGGPLGDVTISLLTSCAPSQLLKWSGTGWACADDVDTDTDTDSGGDITSVVVAATGGLTGGGASGDVGLSLLTSCAAGQLLKWDGAGWSCADDTDTDTNAGGDITSVSTGGGSGLVGGAATGDAALSLVTTCGPGQLLKWSGTAWGCADDIDTDTDTNAGGDITSVSTGGGSGLVGGTATGDAALSLITTCAAGQLLKWNGTGWACADDVDTDTDTNSGGDITDVVAGNGLIGGGANGSATLDVGGGVGVTVTANSVAIDLPFTDGRYVNVTGDTMTGALDMANQRVLNRGCPPGYTRVGPGLCVESADQFGFTFTGCANRCRAQGTHMCSSPEFRSAMASGVALPSTVLLDWIGDQIGDDTALFVNNAGSAENPDGSRAANTSSWCRCCATVE